MESPVHTHIYTERRAKGTGGGTIYTLDRLCYIDRCTECSLVSVYNSGWKNESLAFLYMKDESLKKKKESRSRNHLVAVNL